MSIVRKPDVVLDRMPATTDNVAKRPPRTILRVGSCALAYVCEYAERLLTLLDFLYTLDPTHSNALPSSEW